jgi:hypothetical protein
MIAAAHQPVGVAGDIAALDSWTGSKSILPVARAG